MHHEEVYCPSDNSVCDWVLGNIKRIRINDKKALEGANVEKYFTSNSSLENLPQTRHNMSKSE